MVLIHTCFALKHPLKLFKYGLSGCPVAENTFGEFTSVFFKDGGSQLV